MRIEYVSMVLITGTLTIMAVVWNVSMMVVYKLKLPFLEQYRINPEVGFEVCRSHGRGSRTLQNGEGCSQGVLKQLRLAFTLWVGYRYG